MAPDHPPQRSPVADLLGLAARGPSSGRAVLSTRHGTVDLWRRTAVMGILNLTPDSFYDGGRVSQPKQAIARAVAMVQAGVDMIDLGGESTRPGARPVDEEEERGRILPVLRELRREVQVPLSIDTYKADVARAALDAGADIVNDISALRFDPKMITVVAREKVPVVLMHMQGNPRTMQTEPRYDDVVREVRDFLAAQLYEAMDQGVAQEQVIIDPGIGFGKTLHHNLALLRGLGALAAVGQPLLVGVSRKAFIGKILGEEADERLEGSLAAGVAAVFGGANILRVHDVKETVRSVRVADALIYEKASS